MTLIILAIGTVSYLSLNALISGASTYVMFFKYQKKEKATETKFMEIPIVYEVSNLSHGLEKKDSSSSPNSGTKQHFEFPPRPLLQVRVLIILKIYYV